MTRRIKWLIFTFLLNSLFCTVGRAQTINAASCSSADVQTAFNSVVAATTTVNIPAGTCSWATPVSLTVPGASTTLTIKGAGDTGCPSACNGSTTISDNTPHSSGDIGALNINTAGASSSLRMTGLTFTYSSGAHTFHGSVQINGTTHNL